MKRLIALVPALAASAGLAQELRPERLYLNPSGVLLGSTRVISLGGAYVGVAEGTEGFSSNLAALAHRSHRLERDWDVGFNLSWLDLPFAPPSRRDLDNDGHQDEATETRQTLFGLMLQYKQFGIGCYWKNTSLSYCKLRGLPCEADSQRIVVHLANTALAAAVALGRDDFIAALGFYGASASFTGFLQGARGYSGSGFEFDVLYRPHGLNYRIGVSVRPQVLGLYRPGRPGESTFEDGRMLYSAVVSPSVLSLGASVRLGEGAERYNRYSKAARRDILKRFGEGSIPEEASGEEPAGDWLVTGQLDFISSTDSAVPIVAFVDPDIQAGAREAERVGSQAYLAPRLGVEYEAIPGRLRARAGTYVEPSAFPDRRPRLHGATGFELYLFEYWDKWAVSASGDFAQSYYNVGLSLGLWR